MSVEMKMTDEYRQAIKSIQINPITFLHGSAGTGKSTLIKYIMSKLSNVVLLAPTGVSALNIGGKTVHSFFKLAPKFLFESDAKRIYGSKYDLIRTANLIIIDEVPMLSSNVLDIVDLSLKKTLRNDLPFGGIPILLVGDCFQLSPIVNDSLYNKYYDSSMFYDSNVIKQAFIDDTIKIVNLTEVHRQKNPLFIKILNYIRVGSHIEDVIKVLNIKANISKVAPSGYVHITPYNSVVDTTNQKELDALNGEVKTYFGSVTGKFNEKNIPVSKVLSLKVDAQVMLCRNDSEIGHVNGSIGKVVSLGKDYVEVLFQGDDIVRKIQTVCWEEYDYVKLKDDTYNSLVVGTYMQIPLKLAWCMTIHKVQSATIPKLYIDLDKGAFSHGMLYVALSRAVSLDCLVLSKKVCYDDVIIDENIIKFYKEKCLSR